MTEYEFNAFEAYRICKRSNDENKSIGREDFRSYAELGKPIPRSVDISSYYSVSLSLSEKSLKASRVFHHPPDVIAKGFVFDDGGPVNINRDTYHVDWWMYEDADVSSFEEVEDEKEGI